jgi:hypothetical protein
MNRPSQEPGPKSRPATAGALAGREQGGPLLQRLFDRHGGLGRMIRLVVAEERVARRRARARRILVAPDHRHENAGGLVQIDLPCVEPAGAQPIDIGLHLLLREDRPCADADLLGMLDARRILRERGAHAERQGEDCESQGAHFHCRQHEFLLPPVSDHQVSWL